MRFRFQISERLRLRLLQAGAFVMLALMLLWTYRYFRHALFGLLD